MGLRNFYTVKGNIKNAQVTSVFEKLLFSILYIVVHGP